MIVSYGIKRALLSALYSIALGFSYSAQAPALALAQAQPEAPIPTPRPDPQPTIGQSPPSVFAPFKKDPQCEAKLIAAGIQFKKSGAVAGKAGCGFDEAFEIITLKGGITVTPATQLRCETVLALNIWVDQSVVPNLKQLGTNIKLKNIRQASSYVCRRRNNLPTGKLSEHAKGAAIDIRGFDFQTRKALIIKPRKGTKEAIFQRTIRDAACGAFTTVLGPGSDAYHDDHFHFDIAQRKNNYRYCK